MFEDANVLSSDLDQFAIFRLIPLTLGSLDFSFTNSAFSSLMVLFIYAVLVILTAYYNFYTVKFDRYFVIFHTFIILVLDMVKENVGKNGQFFFSYIFTIFIFILFTNVLGMIPYNFTSTSHLIITYLLAAITFTFINIVGIEKHREKFLQLFLPHGSPFALIALLIPIETISYVFRLISLCVRLFANMMAGHTLLKVIAGFGWKMINAKGVFLIFHLIPMSVVTILVGLELGVAVIQAYVFIILSCIYLRDAIFLH